MIQLIYISHSNQFTDEKDLDELLKVSRRNNHRKGLTGMLLYHNDQFFQVLEGEKTAVNSLYEKIKRDPRHRACRKMAELSIKNRQFDDWSMAFHRITDSEASQLGFSNFMQHQQSNKILANENEALKLLIAFKAKALKDLQRAPA